MTGASHCSYSDGMDAKRFVVKRMQPRGTWAVVDTATGHHHTARMADKARAMRIADRMNARVDQTKGR